MFCGVIFSQKTALVETKRYRWLGRIYSRPTILVLLLIPFPIFVHGQKQANVWHFGHYRSFDFNEPGLPKLLTNSRNYQMEGSAAISDSSGNLLFYSNGIAIFDRRHERLPDEYHLKGSWSSTQSALFVPKPGNPDLFYLFTSDAGRYYDENEGFNYSIVNLCDNGGYGDIIPETRNTNLFDKSTEKIAAVFHANGTDVWVVSHRMESEYFYAYLVTENGISEPVLSKSGKFYSEVEHMAAAGGVLKFSVSGKYLGMVRFTDGILDLYHFDNATGTMSNRVSLSFMYSPWGVEFSQDESKLYVTDGHYELMQFDISTWDRDRIMESRYDFPRGPSDNGYITCMQLAHDGTIFLNHCQTIGKPNEPGAASDYQMQDYFIPFNAYASLGLTDFIQSYFDPYPMIDYSNECGSDVFSLRLSHPDSVFSVSWNFGDPESAGNNLSTARYPDHVFTQPGVYTVNASIVLKSGKTLNKQKKVIWEKIHQVSIGGDTTLCDSTSFDLHAPELTTACYTWHDGSTARTFKATQSGWQWVDVRYRGCTVRDSIYLDLKPQPEIGDDQDICERQLAFFDATTEGADSYLWSTGETSAEIIASAEGTYTVSVSRHGCVGTDSAFLNVRPSPHLRIPVDTSVCSGKVLIIGGNQAGPTYEWSTGSSDPMLHIYDSGSYWVKASWNDCYDRADFHVERIDDFPLSSLDTTICDDRQILFNVERPLSTYYWSTHSIDPEIIVDATGLYTVDITNHCYSKQLSFNVTVEDCSCDITVPNVFTPNADGKNDSFMPVAHQRLTGYYFSVLNRWGKEVFTSSDRKPSWDGMIDGLEAPSGVYFWKISYTCLENGQEAARKKQGFVHLLR